MIISKTDIFINAKELFATKGFKHTSISDITSKTGIAVGSFYKFYASKEEVFLDVFMSESDQLKKQIIATVNLDDDPVVVIKKIVNSLFAGIQENPILREWYVRDVYNKLEKYMNEENGLENDYSYHVFMDIIGRWQLEGKFRNDIDSEIILAMFNTLQYVDLHKNEIGQQHFPKLLDYLIEFIVKGLRV